MDESRPPSASLARCKICHDMMVQLLQLHGDLPDILPNHARRLHVFVCKKKTCRRKTGSIRAIRCVKVERPPSVRTASATERASTHQPRRNLGNEVFGRGLSDPLTNLRPFASSNPTTPNPFSRSTLSGDLRVLNGSPSQSNPEQGGAINLPKSFAEMARISSPLPHVPEPSSQPWPPRATLPTPYPTYHIDAEYETIDNIPGHSPVPMQGLDEDESGSRITSTREDAEAYESSMDRTFQKFADRLAQNPLQILRYDFRGVPLLYSKTDAVGKLLTSSQSSSTETNRVSVSKREAGLRIPNCDKCGSARVFELQVTPQAIAEVEADEVGLEGMDWGTVILGVCSSDCQIGDIADGTVAYMEEWVGVQWED